MNETLLKYWVLCAVLLAAKMWTNSLVQVASRLKDKRFPIAEDAQLFSKLLRTELAPAAIDHPLAERAALCWRNDLENIPLFLILALGYVLIGGSTHWGIAYFAVYSLARIGHTYFYMKRLQPWRTLAYETGSLATIAMAAHSVVLALQ